MSSTKSEQRSEVMKNARSHQVALNELDSLPFTRAVYQKNGNLFFRITTQKALSSEQKLLDQAKSQLQNLTST